MGAPSAKGYSLWLMPGGAERAVLAGWIDRLAARYRTEAFPPHVTLLSGLEGPQAELFATAARSAAGLSPLTVHLDGVTGCDEHFRCVFVKAVEATPLRAAHEAVARAFACPPGPEFLPHLSLVYGSLRPDQKRDLAHELGADVAVRFDAHRLHLWRTHGPVADWREAGVFALGRR
jgi:2'-5' RNA ligase